MSVDTHPFKDTTIDDNNNIFYIIENNYHLFRAISYLCACYE